MQKRYLTESCLAEEIRLGVGLIIYKKNKIILEQRSDCNNWGLVGGRVEIGENIKDAAIRECFEETSIKLNYKKLIYFGIYSDIYHQRIIKYPDSCFHAIDIIYTYRIDGDVTIKKSNESLDIKIFNQHILPENIVAPAQYPINDFIRLNSKIN